MIEANKYASDVINGKIMACRHVINACRRHLNDIERSVEKEYPYYFDEVDARRYTTFISMLNLYKSQWANKPVELQPWQYFIVQVMLGWKRKDTDTRRFKKAYIEMARKNAKTTLAALIGLAVLFIDNESAAQIYSAATKEEQARIVVNDMAGVIQATPMLRDYFQFKRSKEGYSRIIYTDTVSFVRPLGRDSDTQDGFDPYMGIIDEYHEHKTDGLVNVIESGMGARVEPLIIIITTAGFDRTKPCYQYRSAVANILDGTLEDDNVFGIIYTLDEGDDVTDESVWIKSNPNLDISVRKDFLREQLKDAQNRGSKMPAYLTKNMNVWVDSIDTWIATDVWNKQAIEIPHEMLKTVPCWLALDLAATQDINALAILWQTDEGKYYLQMKFFAPLNTARERGKKDGVDYLDWAKKDHLILTDGGQKRRADHGYIKKIIEEFCAKNNVQSIAYDSWNSIGIVNELEQLGFNMQPYSQTISHMSTPTREFERLVLGADLNHCGNPVMTWMIKNVAMQYDSNDNAKIDKKKSTNKVDGPVAAVMALGQHMKDVKEMPVYVW